MTGGGRGMHSNISEQKSVMLSKWRFLRLFRWTFSSIRRNWTLHPSWQTFLGSPQHSWIFSYPWLLLLGTFEHPLPLLALFLSCIVYKLKLSNIVRSHGVRYYLWVNVAQTYICSLFSLLNFSLDPHILLLIWYLIWMSAWSQKSQYVQNIFSSLYFSYAFI